MKIFATVLLMAFSFAYAQDATQKAIAEKIASLSTDAIVTECPDPSEGFSSEFNEDPYHLKTGVCVRIFETTTKDFSQLTIKAFGKQFESSSWFGADPIFMGNWKSSRYFYPLVLLPYRSTALLVVTPAGYPTGANKSPTAMLPTSKAARLAGATPGAGYVSFDDLGRFVGTSRSAPYFDFKLGKQTLTAKLGERRAALNGNGTDLPGVPFTIKGIVYMPVGLLRLLGCTVEVPVNEMGQRNAIIATCVDGGHKMSDVLPFWTF
ncbi:hypothetical protein [Deinococcus irradiatisoli]|uniref:hypothetical protein n=1 Tax=Deinococcus irradiatisoli TaxID=2202254 RepID=UPI0011B25795|nr:hypothetical protein [Deinococcus irradiatisoli]